MAGEHGFGVPRVIAGKGGVFPASAMPLAMLQDIRQSPIPITIGGANRVTFTVKGSTYNTPIWVGNDFVYLNKDLVYTWNATSNPILTSAGAESTDVDSVLGIWYMYLYLTAAGVPTLIPSQTGPADTPGPFNMGRLGHPGTSKDKFYRYVGWMRNTTAATPVFLAAVKEGFTYHFAAVSIATSDTWTARDFTANVPAIDGIAVAGYLSTGEVATVTVGGSSVEDQGVLTVSTVGLAQNIIDAPFGPIVTTGGGKVWSKDTVARGAVLITQVVDIV